MVLFIGGMIVGTIIFSFGVCIGMSLVYANQDRERKKNEEVSSKTLREKAMGN